MSFLAAQDLCSECLVALHATRTRHTAGMNRKEAEAALRRLDQTPARNWRERQRMRATADRLRRIAYRPKREPEPWDLPF